jgi:sugar phosphate isomerase/epimerase
VACGQDTAEAVRRLGKRTFVLYLWDVHITKVSGQVHYDWGRFPGSGDNDWPTIFAAAREVGFDRVFDLMWLPSEMPPKDEITRRLISAREYVQHFLS